MPSHIVSSRVKALLVTAKEKERQEQASLAQQRLDYDAFRASELTRFIQSIPADEYQALFESHRRRNRVLLPHLTVTELDELTHGTVRSEMQRSGRLRLPSLKDFCRARVPAA